MQFSTAFLAAIVAACQFAVIPALGAAADAGDNVILWEVSGFQGTQLTFTNPTGCTEIPNGFGDVSNIVVGAHLECAFYRSSGCVGDPFCTFSGYDMCPDLGPNNDVAASFLCTHDEGAKCVGIDEIV